MSGPRESRCRRRCTWLAEDILRGNRPEEFAGSGHEGPASDDQYAFDGDEPLKTLHGSLQQWDISGEGQELFGERWSRQGPKTRSRPAGKDRGPPTHRLEKAGDRWAVTLQLKKQTANVGIGPQ